MADVKEFKELLLLHQLSLELVIEMGRSIAERGVEVVGIFIWECHFEPQTFYWFFRRHREQLWIAVRASFVHY